MIDLVKKKMKGHAHVYPIDPSLTADEAWDEICLMHMRTTYTGPEQWGVMICDGNECEDIAHG